MARVISDVNKAWTLKAKAKAWTLKAKAWTLKAKAKAWTLKAKAKAWTLKAKAWTLKAKAATSKIAILTRIFAFLQLQHPWNAYFRREYMFHSAEFPGKSKIRVKCAILALILANIWI